MADPGGLHLHRFPQPHHISAIRWLPYISPFERLSISSVHYPSPSLEVHILSKDPDISLLLRHSIPLPSPATALRASSSTVAAATAAGSLHLLLLDPIDASLTSEQSVPELHKGPVAAADLREGDGACVTVGEDGAINVVAIGEGQMEKRWAHDSRGLRPFTAVRWGSPTEFATGGIGFGVQWWDHRKPGGLVAQFKGSWGQGSMTGMVHSIDIHPSRKHISLVGGSMGTIFAWDLRWQQQPIVLSGVGVGETAQPACESEVWEVQYDGHTQSSSMGSAPSTRILPVMMCSEDGILAILEQGEEPIELLTEPCAINSFDIDPHNPSDVICALEWETIGILMRSRTSLPTYRD